MRKTISIMAAAAMVAPVAMATTAANQPQHEQLRIRHLSSKSSSSSSSSSHDGWGKPPQGWWGPPPSSSSSSSGKSGKSGGSGSGKSGKGSSSSSSDDHPHHGHWAWAGGPSSWIATSSSSGKSGKSGGGSGSKSGKGSSSNSSSSSDDAASWHGGWGKQGWWGPSSSSSSSGKSGKSGGGSSKGSKGSSKSGKGNKSSKGSSSSSSSNDFWGPPPGWHGHDHNHSSSSNSGKSGKSGGGSGSGSSGDHSHGHWHWAPKPWSSSSSSSGSSSSPDGIWYNHSHEHSHSSTTSTSEDVVVAPPKPDSSSPGVCAPAFDEGGLECDVDEFSYCTGIGVQAECGAGMTCYDKELCPDLRTIDEDPIGVCDSSGKGLECDEVTTYCTEPGDHGECGSGRNCYDAGLCEYGKGEYDGVCGFVPNGGKHSGLDCDRVTTKCTEPGEYAECAYGAKCFDAALCEDGKGFCSNEDDFDCENTSTFCAHPGEPGQCPHGQKCYDVDVCTPTKPPKTAEPETSVPTYAPTELGLAEVCFYKGKIVDCWGDDGYGDAIAVPFTYIMDTDGKTDPESALNGMENAILDDVVDFMLENEDYADYSGKISASPEDTITKDEYCGGGGAARCSVVKGEMSFAPLDGEAWSGDGHDDDNDADGAWAGDGHSSDIDACAAAGIIKDSMEGQDYSEVDGVTHAAYRHTDLECGKIISGANIVVVESKNEGLSAGAAFGILMLALALLALLYRKTRRRRREMTEPEKEDFSLISNSLNGSYLDGADPYANTIDVHKCTSLFCNCNKAMGDTTFLPAPSPSKVNMAQTMAAHGISASAFEDATLYPEEEEKVEEGAYDEDTTAGVVPPPMPGGDVEEFVPVQDSIMRQQYAEHDRPLTPVNEIAHDSEIDTEMESMAGDADDTTVPPPPPLAFHPAYQQGSGAAVMQSDDEISI